MKMKEGYYLVSYIKSIPNGQQYGYGCVTATAKQTPEEFLEWLKGEYGEHIVIIAVSKLA